MRRFISSSPIPCAGEAPSSQSSRAPAQSSRAAPPYPARRFATPPSLPLPSTALPCLRSPPHRDRATAPPHRARATCHGSAAVCGFPAARYRWRRQTSRGKAARTEEDIGACSSSFVTSDGTGLPPPPPPISATTAPNPTPAALNPTQGTPSSSPAAPASSPAAPTSAVPRPHQGPGWGAIPPNFASFPANHQGSNSWYVWF